MVKYFLKRVFLFLPTLFVISLVVFLLGRMAPGNPSEKYCDFEDADFKTEIEREEACLRATLNYNLDKPNFYFSLTQKAFVPEIDEISRDSYRKNVKDIVAQYGNWIPVKSYYENLLSAKKTVYQFPDSLKNEAYFEVKNSINALFINSDDNRISNLLQTTQFKAKTIPSLGVDVDQLITDYNEIKSSKSTTQLWIPKFNWYGTDNQYHIWISNFLSGDFGNSYFDNRKVTDRIWESMSWTVLMNLIAIFLAYMISVPLGVYSAAHKDSLFDNVTTIGLFLLHALPVFWIATLLIVFFTTPEYGNWTDIFPTSGVGNLPSDAPFWSRFWNTAYHLVLPISCITYTAFAFITRQIRNGMLEINNQQYMTTAAAKGLPQKDIIWKHGFKNGIFPLITMLATIFPAVFSGSVVVEIIFGIPGMGRLAYDAILQQDWPVVNTILMMAAILTIFGYLLADILYRLFDPRVTFD